MKVKNANNSKKRIVILSAVGAVCLIVIIVLLCFALNGRLQNNSQGQDNSMTVGTPDENRDAIEIVTTYGTLLYPKEWESNLRTEIIDRDEYKVEFYGKVEGKQEQHLFDLIFNGTEGYNLGALKTENGEDVQLNVVSYDFDLDDTWTDDEKDVIYSMVEDINYTIGMLAESGKLIITN